jgi:capsule polysaccharide export protein KpsE/RkpR
MLKKAYEKIDQWLFLVLGIVLTLVVIIGVIKFALWAEPIVQSKFILRKLLGWLFK